MAGGNTRHTSRLPAIFGAHLAAALDSNGPGTLLVKFVGHWVEVLGLRSQVKTAGELRVTQGSNARKFQAAAQATKFPMPPRHIPKLVPEKPSISAKRTLFLCYASMHHALALVGWIGRSTL